MGRRKGPRHTYRMYIGRKPLPQRLEKNLFDYRRIYGYFKPQWHVQELKLDAKFISSLTPKIKILEIGAATGRLANFLLKKSSLRPENYHMMDIAYDKYPPWMKRGIYDLAKEGKIKLIEGDMYKVRLPRNTYDHILIPEAFLPSWEMQEKVIKKAGLQKLLTKGTDTYEAEAHRRIVRDLVMRLEPSLRQGGSIRISHIPALAAIELLADEKLRKTFNLEISGGALILRKS